MQCTLASIVAAKLREGVRIPSRPNTQECFVIRSSYYRYRTLRKICQNTGFRWPFFCRIRTESTILSLYGKIRVREYPYSDILSWVVDWVTWLVWIQDSRLEALSFSIVYFTMCRVISRWITTDLLVWHVEKLFSSLYASNNSNKLQHIPKYLV